MSKRVLAKKSKTEIDTIERIEKGNYEDVNMELLIKLSNALEISILTLLRDGMTINELNEIVRKGGNNV